MPDTVVGLDLGQQADPSAAVVLRRSACIDRGTFRPVRDARGRCLVHRFDCTAAKRWPLGESYEAIVAHIAGQMARPEFRPRTMLVIDQTGVGRPVVERFRSTLAGLPHVAVVGITITGGWSSSRASRDEWHVSKTELVGALRSAMGTKRVNIPPKLEHADTIRREAFDFQVRVSKSANELYAAREGKHDDLLLSLAMGVWLSTQVGAGVEEFVPDDRHELARHLASLDPDGMAEAEALLREQGRETPAMAEARVARWERLRANPGLLFEDPDDDEGDDDDG
jgi:hypothetical protein